MISIAVMNPKTWAKLKLKLKDMQVDYSVPAKFNGLDVRLDPDIPEGKIKYE